MAVRNWRNACSLIIACRSKESKSNFDYNLMMLKRSSKTSFMPTAYVFPGGVCEKSDFSPSWLDIFANHGAGQDRLVQDFVQSRTGPAPLLYKDIKVPDLLPEVGFRISAIRETFEETGILFCKGNTSDAKQQVTIDLKEWRHRVIKNPSEFETLCKTYKLCPDVWSLFEWSNWLTPVDVGPKRFDTMFYICILDDKPTIKVDNKEITNFAWIDPVNSVKCHLKKEIWLAPPQLYEVSRLARFTSIGELSSFARQRETMGTDRYLPVRYDTEDGALSVLPGDSLYPAEVNLFEARTEVLSNETVETARQNYPKLHRLEAVSPVDFHIHCNIQVPCGHLPPLNLIQLLRDLVQESKL